MKKTLPKSSKQPQEYVIDSTHKNQVSKKHSLIWGAALLPMIFAILFVIMGEDGNNPGFEDKKPPATSNELCEELMSQGYLIAHCESIPFEELQALAKVLGKVKHRDLKHLLRLLNVDKATFHREIKKDLIQMYLTPKLKQRLGKNPDIGFTAKPGFLVFIGQNQKVFVYTNATEEFIKESFTTND